MKGKIDHADNFNPRSSDRQCSYQFYWSQRQMFRHVNLMLSINCKPIDVYVHDLQQTKFTHWCKQHASNNMQTIQKHKLITTNGYQKLLTLCCFMILQNKINVCAINKACSCFKTESWHGYDTERIKSVKPLK